MNLLNSYLKEIIKQVKNNKEINSLLSEKNFSNINIDIPPESINFDLSSNIALVLGKETKLIPKKLQL